MGYIASKRGKDGKPRYYVVCKNRAGIALDENFKFIQQQMGHASIATTMDLCGHRMPEASAWMSSSSQRTW